MQDDHIIQRLKHLQEQQEACGVLTGVALRRAEQTVVEELFKTGEYARIADASHRVMQVRRHYERQQTIKRRR